MDIDTTIKTLYSKQSGAEVERAERGLIDANLGGGVIKQRIARPGAGKSKGYRSIVIYRKGEKAFFVYGFPKSELGNIRDDEEEQFKKAAKSILALSDDQIRQLMIDLECRCWHNLPIMSTRR